MCLRYMFLGRLNGNYIICIEVSKLHDIFAYVNQDLRIIDDINLSIIQKDLITMNMHFKISEANMNT